MKYLKLFESWSNKILTLEDISINMKDDGFDVKINPVEFDKLLYYYNELKDYDEISIKVIKPDEDITYSNNNWLKFQLTDIKEDIERMIEYMKSEGYSCSVFHSDTNLSYERISSIANRHRRKMSNCKDGYHHINLYVPNNINYLDLRFTKDKVLEWTAHQGQNDTLEDVRDICLELKEDKGFVIDLYESTQEQAEEYANDGYEYIEYTLIIEKLNGKVGIERGFDEFEYKDIEEVVERLKDYLGAKLVDSYIYIGHWLEINRVKYDYKNDLTSGFKITFKL